MTDFHEEQEDPDWFVEMVAAGMTNIVNNVLVTVLPYTAEHLDEEGAIAETTRGEDYAIVFETVENAAEEIHRIIFAIPPEGGAALAAMLLRRLPAPMVMALATQAMSNPGPCIVPEHAAIPMSPEGQEWNAKRNAQRGGHG